MKIQGNRKCFTTVRKFILGAFAASVVMSSFNEVRAAGSDQVFAKVQQEVAADPGHAEAILAKELKSLSRGERKQVAAGMFAAALQGLGKPPLAVALNLFKIAYQASPGSLEALLSVANLNYPANIAAFTNEAKAAGQPSVLQTIASFLAKLDDGKDVAPPPTLDPGFLGSGALGGSINPANIGGSVLLTPVSPEK